MTNEITKGRVEFSIDSDKCLSAKVYLNGNEEFNWQSAYKLPCELNLQLKIPLDSGTAKAYLITKTLEGAFAEFIGSEVILNDVLEYLLKEAEAD